jgi:hypothetical protein
VRSALVDAVSELHKNGYVHRDIKPENIFIGDDGRLVLRDFGLVINPGSDATRLTATYENVGSRDWAMTGRNDEVNPTFDIFTLCKVLWSMVSGQRLLHLWYFNEPEYDLEVMFPNDPDIRWVTHIFRYCIVQREINCLRDATELLAKFDEAIDAVRHDQQVLRKSDGCFAAACVESADAKCRLR